jgi:hypothetical protein
MRMTDDTVQLVVQLADAYPEGLQHKDEEGNLPIDLAVMKGKTRVIRSLQKYDEDKLERLERKKYQDNLEQEKQRIEKSFEKEVAP